MKQCFTALRLSVIAILLSACSSEKLSELRKRIFFIGLMMNCYGSDYRLENYKGFSLSTLL